MSGTTKKVLDFLNLEWEEEYLNLNEFNDKSPSESEGVTGFSSASLNRSLNASKMVSPKMESTGQQVNTGTVRFVLVVTNRQHV